MTAFRLPVLFLLPLGLLCATVGAQSEKPPPLTVPSVSIRDTLPLSKALAEVRRQTGVTVQDGLGGDREVSLALDRASFWQAVEAVAVAARAKAVQSGRDGSVTLQPLLRGERRPPVSHDGPFRVRVLRISTSQDLDSDRGSCL